MKKILYTIGLGVIHIFLFFALGSNILAQELEFTEWEKQTFLKQPPEQIMDIAGIKSGMIIGEIGAGNGRITVHLAQRTGLTGRVFANDINEKVLETLKNRCENSGLTNVEIILGQENNPLFPKDSLDIAIMVWTYHWLKEPVIFLKNLMPALKPGANVVLVEPDPVRGPGGEDNGVSVDRMKIEAEMAGFDLVFTSKIFPEDLIFILSKKKQ